MRPLALLAALLLAFAAFVGSQVVRPSRRPASSAGASYAATDGDGGADAASPAPRPARDADGIRRRLAAGSYGTYIDDILRAQDSALQRWPERRESPIGVWVQPTSDVAGWAPRHVQLARDGFLTWEQAGLPLRFAFVGDSASAEVQVVWVAQLPAPRIGSTYRLHDQDGWIRSGVIRIATHGSRGQTLDDDVLRATATHEVGHLLGLNHTADSTSIMSPEAQAGRHLLSSSDRATAELLYGVEPGSVKGQ